ncbi:hypothetical protein F4778DRAFT_784484 [Xylariomycetidae sp. FL2044]|nr:hypothetical protein F4778DRAFT_784484 [Xylariomycetidae sp. FL2044]
MTMDSDESPGRHRRKKAWAEEYINGPLHAVTPSEITGPRAPLSHFNPQRSLSVRTSSKTHRVHYPTPPASASAAYTSNPWSYTLTPEEIEEIRRDKEDEERLISQYFNPTSSRQTKQISQSQELTTLDSTTSTSSNTDRKQKRKFFRRSTFTSFLKRPSIEQSEETEALYSSNSKQPEAIERRPSIFHRLRRKTFATFQHSKRDIVTGPPGISSDTDTMAARPLEQIRKETKAAYRSPHLRKGNLTGADPIDALDNIAGVYHHDGPYDATLAARNKDEKWSPVAATRYGNMAALKATPEDNIKDSLHKHVPLQGVASIPPGEQDFAGRRMSYEEGADLMREADAPGGAYKRYEHVQYHPDDLKGKGEPSYTIERDLKERKHGKKASLSRSSNGEHSPGVYEMQPTTTTTTTGYTTSRSKNNGADVTVRRHHRATSSGSTGPSSPVGIDDDAGMRRSNTTGRRLSDGSSFAARANRLT